MIRMSILGNLTADPAEKTLPNGKICVAFTVAATGNDRDEVTGKPASEFWNVTVFGRTGENVLKYCTKGRAVLVIGKPTARVFTGRDGKDRVARNIMADIVEFIGSNPRGDTEAPAPSMAQQTYGTASQGFVAIPSEDLPDLPF